MIWPLGGDLVDGVRVARRHEQVAVVVESTELMWK